MLRDKDCHLIAVTVTLWGRINKPAHHKSRTSAMGHKQPLTTLPPGRLVSAKRGRSKSPKLDFCTTAQECRTHDRDGADVRAACRPKTTARRCFQSTGISRHAHAVRTAAAFGVALGNDRAGRRSCRSLEPRAPATVTGARAQESLKNLVPVLN
jgi:hypothetical protein